MTTEDRHNDRLKRNADSLGKADHHREPWSVDELDWLQAWEPGDETLLAEIAEVLGRTSRPAASSSTSAAAPAGR